MTVKPEDVGKKTARFEGTIALADSYTAVYPSTAIESFYSAQSNTISVAVPSTQHYRAGGFAKGSNIAIGSTANATEPIILYNAGGLLKLTIKGSTSISIARIELQSSTSSEFLAGYAVLSKYLAEGPRFNFTSENSLSSMLTLDCGGGVALTPEGKDFYFCVPTGKLGGGFLVRIFDTEGGMMAVQAPASQNNVINRSDIKVMPPITYEINIPEKFVKKVIPGIYSDCLNNPVLETAFLTYTVQGGVALDGDKQVFSLKNWDREYIVDYRMPAVLVQGTTYDINVVPSIGDSGVSAHTLRLKFLISENGLGWFLDETTGKGYIMHVL